MDFGYPPESLIHDDVHGCWTLVPSFDATTMLLHIDTGQERRRSGVFRRPERHDPTDVILRDARGNALARGTMTADAPIFLNRPRGGSLRLDRIEIGGTVRLLMASEPLEPGMTYEEEMPASEVFVRARPEEIAALPCLGAGSSIATDEGEQPIDWLRPGDKVLTRDNGYQPLLWVGQVALGRLCPPSARPLTLQADCFGPALPQRPLTLTRGHGLLLAAPELQLWFGDNEMFARADQVVRPGDTAAPAPHAGRQVLYHMLFAEQEVVLAEGLWVETLRATPDYTALLPDSARRRLAAKLAGKHRDPARSWLESWEVAMFSKETKSRQMVAAA
ncbi:Hint domain-containing protein [Phaeovulum sp. W22_SRMD_FR3]|uniref:Hint domain-containing protein n=1 Tax=Phaeovulum sp. W22_SRMD_FR3 TaxID=3240274 RepID=UPI003F9C4A66